MSEFNQRLKHIREEKGLSREELAKAVNLSYWAIAKYESGERTPDSTTLQKLADFFGVTVDYLLGRTNDPTPSGPKVSHDQNISEADLEAFLEKSNVNLAGEVLPEDLKDTLLQVAKIALGKQQKKKQQRPK